MAHGQITVTKKDRRIPKGELTSLAPISRVGHFPRIQEPQVLLGSPSRLHYFATLPVPFSPGYACWSRRPPSALWTHMLICGRLAPPNCFTIVSKSQGARPQKSFPKKLVRSPRPVVASAENSALHGFCTLFASKIAHLNILRMNGVHGSIDAGVNWSDSNLDMRSFSMLCQRGDSVRKC